MANNPEQNPQTSAQNNNYEFTRSENNPSTSASASASASHFEECNIKSIIKNEKTEQKPQTQNPQQVPTKSNFNSNNKPSTSQKRKENTFNVGNLDFEILDMNSITEIINKSKKEQNPKIEETQVPKKPKENDENDGENTRRYNDKNKSNSR